jgi:hypothetical protein
MRLVARKHEAPVAQPATTVPEGTPPWVTAELIVDTIETWQPYYEEQLTSRDALEILLSVAHLVDALE